MRSDIVPGAILPDYELSDHTMKRRKLSERVLTRDEMLDDITLYWLTGVSRLDQSARDTGENDDHR